MNLKVLISFISIFLVLTIPLTSAVNTLGIVDKDIDESSNLITGAATGLDNTVIVPSSEDYNTGESSLLNFNENFANIMVTVGSYEPTVLTSAVLEEGRKIPVFVNLKAYSADPTLEDVRILSMTTRVREVRTTPDRGIGKPTVQTRFNRDTTLDNIGYLVVWLNRLDQEHAPVEETTLFTDLPEEKQQQILNETDLTGKSEEEIENILAEQTKSLIKREEDQEWVLDLPRKQPFLEQIDIDLELNILFETAAGFGAFEESKVGKAGDRISFWNGQGTILIKDITEKYVILDVFSGDSRLIRKDLKLGIGDKATDDLGRGFQFNDQFTLTMDKIRKPENTASFLVNDKLVELVVGESFPRFPNLVVDNINEYRIQYDDGTIKKIQQVRIKDAKTGKTPTLIRSQPQKVGEDKKEIVKSSQFKAPNELINYENIINDFSTKRSLDPYLVSAVIMQESKGNAKSIGPIVNVNGEKVKAAGLMQLIPSTAREIAQKLGLGVNIINIPGEYVSDSRFDPNININLGTYYLRQQLDDFKDTRLALAAYNWGPKRVNDNCKDANGNLNYDSCKFGSNTETPKYVNLVMEYYDDFNKKSPTKVSSVNLLSQYQQAIDKFDDVIQNYPDAIDDQGNNIVAKALHEKAKIYENIGDNEKAKDIYTNLADKYKDYYVKFLPNKIPELNEKIAKGELLWDTTQAILADESVVIILKDVKLLTSEKSDKAIIATSKDGKNYTVDSSYQDGYLIGNSINSWEITRIEEDSITLTKRAKTQLERDTDRIVKKGSVVKLDDTYVMLQDTNINIASREAKFTITPRTNRARSTTEVTLHLPIEQRAIQLSSEQIKDQIKHAEDVVKKLENIISKLDKIVRWWKIACFTIGGYLTVKNFFSGSAKVEARQMSMDKWSSKCTGNDVDFNDCISKNADAIDKDTEKLENAINLRNDFNKNINAKLKETKKSSYNKLTKTEIKSSLQGITFGEYDKDIDSILEKQDLNQADLGKLITAKEYSKLANDNNQYFNEVAATLRIKEKATRWNQVNTYLKDNFSVTDPSRDALKTKFKVDDEQLNTILSSLYSGVSDLNKAVVIKDGNEYYLLGPNGKIKVDKTNDKQDNNLVYKDDKGKKYINLLEIQDKSIEITNKKILRDGFGRVEIAPYAGQTGKYIRVVYRTETTDYTRIDQIIIFSSGQDGKMLEGDDNQVIATCNSRGTPTCTPTEFERLSRQAIDLNEKLRSDKDAKEINYGGTKIVIDNLERSKNCEDYMGAKDCQLMYNVCDWVICPSSRFDFGGKWKVDNVIQSGIVGSIILGLPRNKVCVTGILAGLKNIQSIYKGYGQCLQTARAEDKSVGLCDKIRSVYVCELIWKSAVPLAAAGVQKVLDKTPSGEGGGEYSNFNTAYENAENTFNYFVHDYAEDSFSKFRVSSVDEVGTNICQKAIFGTVPGGADFLDQLSAPANPPQFTAWFDEYVWSKETIKTSRYSVFYQIYAGDGGDLIPFNQDYIQYNVYLTDPVLGVYPVTQSPNIRRINLGESAQETADFIAPSGYSQICVELNGRAYCNFGKVTTGAGLSYVTDLFVSNQASKKISSFEDCTSNYGTGKYQGSTSNNLLFGTRISTSPYSSSAQGGTGQDMSSLGDFRLGLFGNGIIRTCNNGNPNPNTVSISDANKPKWVKIGECGTDKKTNANYGECWLDIDSVASSLSTELVRDNTLSEITQKDIEEATEVLAQAQVTKDDETKLFNELNKIANLNEIKEASINITKEKINLLNEFISNNPLSENVLAEANFRLGVTYERLASLSIEQTVEESSEKAIISNQIILYMNVKKSLEILSGVELELQKIGSAFITVYKDGKAVDCRDTYTYTETYTRMQMYFGRDDLTIINKGDTQSCFDTPGLTIKLLETNREEGYVKVEASYDKKLAEKSTSKAVSEEEKPIDFKQDVTINLGGYKIVKIGDINYKFNFDSFKDNQADFLIEKQNNENVYERVDCGGWFTDIMTLKNGESKLCGDLKYFNLKLNSIDVSSDKIVANVLVTYNNIKLEEAEEFSEENEVVTSIKGVCSDCYEVGDVVTIDRKTNIKSKVVSIGLDEAEFEISVNNEPIDCDSFSIISDKYLEVKLGETNNCDNEKYPGISIKLNDIKKVGSDVGSGIASGVLFDGSYKPAKDLSVNVKFVSQLFNIKGTDLYFKYKYINWKDNSVAFEVFNGNDENRKQTDCEPIWSFGINELLVYTDSVSSCGDVSIKNLGFNVDSSFDIIIRYNDKFLDGKKDIIIGKETDSQKISSNEPDELSFDYSTQRETTRKINFLDVKVKDLSGTKLDLFSTGSDTLVTVFNPDTNVIVQDTVVLLNINKIDNINVKTDSSGVVDLSSYFPSLESIESEDLPTSSSKCGECGKESFDKSCQPSECYNLGSCFPIWRGGLEGGISCYDCSQARSCSNFQNIISCEQDKQCLNAVNLNCKWDYDNGYCVEA